MIASVSDTDRSARASDGILVWSVVSHSEGELAKLISSHMILLSIVLIANTEVLSDMNFPLLVALDKTAEGKVRLAEVADLAEARLDALVGLSTLFLSLIDNIHNVGVILIPSVAFSLRLLILD